MKRIGAILTLVALLVTLSTSLCFADDGLTLESSYPKDGSKGASIENLGVKLYFDGTMTEEKAGKANKDEVFQLYDSKGKKLPTRTLYNSTEEGVVLVLLDTNAKKAVKVESNSEYTLKISEELVDDNGNKLGKAQEITFRTLNQSVNTMISMGMMVVMFGGMMLVSVKSAQKAVEEERKKQEKVNPYKEAKKTGKSVEEIVEKDQKRKAKEAEKAAKRAAREAAEEDYEEEEKDTYRVKNRRPASVAGSKYVAERKAAAEKARAEAAKRKAAAKKKKK